jgi:hypothetical protein
VSVNLPPSVGIEMLISQVRSAGLNHGHETSLVSRLQKAQHELASGHVGSAAHELEDFASEVRMLLRAHIITATTANLWLFEEGNILAALPPR